MKDIKNFGFGLLRLPHIDPNDNTDIDLDEMIKMVDKFMESGFMYFDTAYSYLGYKSEAFFKKAVADRYPRESYSITTKLPCLELKETDDARRFFQTSLDRCGVEYFDFYFLHSLNKAKFDLAEKCGWFNLLSEVKAEGKAKKIGFSFHDSAEVLDVILTKHPEVDVVQIQLNYLDWENPTIQSRACYEVCVKHNKPVVVMEPIKGGNLINIPEKALEKMKAYNPEASTASWALRFAASQPDVMMVLSGMGNMEQMEQNLSFMKDFKPLNEEEMAILRECAEIIRNSVAIGCTGCSYCTDGCPVGIPIPRYFALYNENERDKWQANAKARYQALVKDGFTRASGCLSCRQCEFMCPQKLPITQLLPKVAQKFE